MRGSRGHRGRRLTGRLRWIIALLLTTCAVPSAVGQLGATEQPWFEQRTNAAVQRLEAVQVLIAGAQVTGADGEEALDALVDFFDEGHQLLVYSHGDVLSDVYATWQELADRSGDPQAVVSAMTARGSLRLAQADPDGAFGVLLSAKAVLQGVPESERAAWVELRLHRRLAQVALDVRDWITAAQSLKTYDTRAQQLDAQDHRALGLAFVALLQWDHKQSADPALPFAERALEVLRRATSTDPLIDSRTLKICADVLRAAGEVVRAESLYHRCLETSNDPATTVAAHGMLGQLLLAQGRVTEAVSHLGQATEAARDPVAEGLRLDAELALANAEVSLGNLDAAMERYEGVIRAWEVSGDTDKARDARNNRGTILLHRERYEEAAAIFETLVTEAGEAGDILAEGQALTNWGIALQEQGLYEEAERAYVRLDALASGTGNDLALAAASIGLAQVRARMGRTDGALADLAAAVEIYDRRLRPLDALYAHEVAVELHLAAGRIEEADALLVDAELRVGRAGVEDLLSFERASVLSLHARWSGLAQDLVLAGVEASVPEDGGVPVRRGPVVLEAWRRAGLWKSRALLEGMKREGAPGREASQLEASVLLSAAMKQLAEGEVLVDFCTSTDRLLAYVLSDGDLVLIDLGERAPIEERAETFASMLVTYDASPLGAVLDAGHALYADVLAAAVLHLGGVPPRLMVVPTAELSRVPFDALVLENPPFDERPEREPGSERAEPVFLLDRSLVRYSPSTAVLCALGQRSRGATPERALLLGDASYQAEDSAPTRTAAWTIPVLERLPASRSEIVKIATRLMRRRGDGSHARHAQHLQDLLDGTERHDSLETPGVTLHVGREARPGCLDGSLEGYDLLHFAVHAIVHPEDPRRSGLVLSFDEQTRGLVGLPRILELSLDGPVVVLSACRTADGPIIRGEGVQSLSAAFLEAGARTTIASLWVVEDDDTARLMDGFYKRWLQGDSSPAEALRQAKLVLRRRGQRGGRVGGRIGGHMATVRHPHQWAAFILTGLDY